jgi:hypothetical protein
MAENHLLKNIISKIGKISLLTKILSELEDSIETINATNDLNSQLVSQLNYHLNNSFAPTSNNQIHMSLERLVSASLTQNGKKTY